ncbi:hypothetical protein B1B_14187 [mine drainage metagenome]|uniref:Plasmid conjugative transfer protein PilI domain-containing protein n=1 Tax=mine drainage metagenome TaxID=410659 RepID=T0ZD39_9ZZZZ
MSAFQVIIWDNSGLRSVHDAPDRSDALRLAKRARTLINRTVKVADCFGSTHHWTRSQSASKNQWNARAVADEFFS